MPRDSSMREIKNLFKESQPIEGGLGVEVGTRDLSG